MITMRFLYQKKSEFAVDIKAGIVRAISALICYKFRFELNLK